MFLALIRMYYFCVLGYFLVKRMVFIRELSAIKLHDDELILNLMDKLTPKIDA